jgi:anaerobic magnesium-protoporphyrin IX monomethyl ester cyclase
MAPWRLFLWVKFIEAVSQLRPRALKRWLWNPDPKIRHAVRWYYRMGRRVWFHEIRDFFFRDRTTRQGLSVADFLGEVQDHEEESMVVGARDTQLASGALTS